MIAANLRNKWRRLVPDRVAVTYRVRTALPGTYTDLAISDAWWRPGGSGEAAPSAGVYTRAARTWYVPKAVLATAGATAAPAPGDLLASPANAPIDPAALTWTVLGANDAGALGCWALDCLSLALANGLAGTVTFGRPVSARDSAGRPALASYATVASGVACRIQPQGGDPTDVMEQRRTPRRFTCYLESPLTLQAHDRATSDGTAYTVLGWRNPERLTDLFECDLERVG